MKENRIPMVSIIVPVYNAEKYLKQCMKSILGQSLSDFEIICVDDGSTDDSLKILEEYQKKDNRVKVYTQTNQYAGAARNHGIEKACGQYIIFLDADDFFEEDLLQKTVSIAEAQHADIVLFGADIFDQEKKIFLPASWELDITLLPDKKSFSVHDVADHIFQIVGTGPCNKLYRRSFVETYKFRYPNLRNSEDVPFVCAALVSAQTISYSTDVFLHIRREHGTNLEAKKDTNPFDFFKAYQLLKEYLQDQDYYSLVTRSFINRAFDSAIYQINTLKTEKAKKEVIEFLFASGFAELEINYKPFGYFYNTWNVRSFQTLCQEMGVVWEQCFPKISVIVPVYNVEKYLPECIESIQKQTLKNLEIILVDDGATDNSGEICDEYARQDNRIIVVHKKNGGLSDARNAGLEIATGELIGFVDSDDYIAENMYEVLYNNMLEHDSDIAIGDIVYVNEMGMPLTEQNQGSPIKDECFTGNQAQQKLVESQNHYYVVVWSKLYRREIFQTLRFKKGKIHEDEFLVHHVFSLANRVSTVKQGVYCYRQRNASITTKEYSTKRLDALEAFYERATFYRENMQFDLARKTEELWVWFVMQAYSKYVFTDSTFQERFFSLLDVSESAKNRLLKNELIAKTSKTQLNYLLITAQAYKKRKKSVKKCTVVVPDFAVDVEICIQELLQQSLKDIELICIVGHTEEQTRNTLLEIAKKTDNILLLPLSDEKPELTYNIALSVASGQYITFYHGISRFKNLDSFENWYHDTVQKHVVVSYSNVQTVNKQGLITESFRENQYYFEPALYLTDFLKQKQIYFTSKLEYQTPNLFQFKVKYYQEEMVSEFSDVYVTRLDTAVFCENAVIKSMLYSVIDSLHYTKKKKMKDDHKEIVVWLEERFFRYCPTIETVMDKELLELLFAAKFAIDLDLLEISQNDLSRQGYPLPYLDRYLDSIYVRQENNTADIPISMEREEKKGFFRLVQGGIRCYREHGLKYTIRRIFEKAANRLGDHG